MDEAGELGGADVVEGMAAVGAADDAADAGAEVDAADVAAMDAAVTGGEAAAVWADAAARMAGYGFFWG